MLIGSYLIVKNAETTIRDYIKYYIDHQGINILFIIDNGSLDNTRKIVKKMNDRRIVLADIQNQSQNNWNSIIRHIIKELTSVMKCDWVIPLKIYEYYFSNNYKTVRQALYNIKKENRNVEDILFLTQSYSFSNTELDDMQETCFQKRMNYCKTDNFSKPIMYRPFSISDDLEFEVYANPSIEAKNCQIRKLASDELSCFSYPTVNYNQTVNHILNIAESLIIESNGKWLRGKDKKTRAIFEAYNKIKNDEFVKYYNNNFFLSQTKIESGTINKTILKKPQLAAFWELTTH